MMQGGCEMRAEKAIRKINLKSESLENCLNRNKSLLACGDIYEELGGCGDVKRKGWLDNEVFGSFITC